MCDLITPGVLQSCKKKSRRANSHQYFLWLYRSWLTRVGIKYDSDQIWSNNDVIRTVLLLLTGRGFGRRDRGRRSIVNRRLRLMRMRMRGVDGRRRHVGQGRRRRARLMMIGTMMNAAPRVESISAPVDDRRRRRGWQTGGSAAQNHGARGAAAGHGAAGHGYGWKTALVRSLCVSRPFIRSRFESRRCRRIIADAITLIIVNSEKRVGRTRCGIFKSRRTICTVTFWNALTAWNMTFEHFIIESY